MSERTSIRQALEPLHASEGTLEEVLKVIDGENTQRTYKRGGRAGSRTMRMALFAAALALALAGTAYAVGEYTGFFETVFGNGSIGSWDQEYKTYTDEDGNVLEQYVVPGQERVEADPEAAQALVGDETASVGKSVTVAGVTFTVEDFVMDEYGMGALTYTMEDPEGFPGVVFDGSIIISDTMAGGKLMGPLLTARDGSGRDVCWLDSHSYVAGGTDTKKTMVLYFAPLMYYAPFESMTDAEQLNLLFTVVIGRDEAKGELHIREGNIHFPIADAVGAETLTGTDGWSAGISPVGLMIASPDGMRSGYDYYFNDVTIHMADGAEYVLKQSEPYMYNITAEAGSDDGSAMVFNRLVDPAQVQSVTAVGRDTRTDTDFTLTFTK